MKSINAMILLGKQVRGLLVTACRSSSLRLYTRWGQLTGMLIIAPPTGGSCDQLPVLGPPPLPLQSGQPQAQLHTIPSVLGASKQAPGPAASPALQSSESGT